ncbi:MAG: MBL fold metallo-hydrolase [Patescibacteria group bacterium]|nr:MBL fold metallo-hydrolase [Patescibacteria group bacterium]
MTITWYGQACLRIETAGTAVFIDPFSKELGLTPPRAKTDIVFITHEHYDHNNREPFSEATIVDGPGEYDVKGIAAKGIPSFHDTVMGKERGGNTIYRIEAEDMALVHMGDFGELELRNEELEAMGAVDILAIPVGGTYTIDAETAAKIVNQVEPKIVIPIHYALPRINVKLEPVDAFLKAIGQKPEPQPRLTLKKKDLAEGGTKVVVLTPPALT